MKAKVFGILMLLVALCAYLSVFEPQSFLTGNNLENLLRRTAMYGILGIGVAFVIISSGIDLSIGSIVCLSGCLLAIFLRVDYAPFDDQPILAVQSSAQQIVVPAKATSFAVGDRIRYYGGRRARNALLTITAIESTQFDGQAALSFQVDQPLNSDDSYGQIASVYEIVDFAAGDAEGTSTVTISGSHPDLARRDQLTLVHPERGLKQLKVLQAEATGQTTVVTLNDDLGTSFDRQWLAIPVERQQRMSIAAALAAVMSIAILLGLIHGLLITKIQLQPFVVTLCGLLFYRGISRWLVDDQVQGFGDEFNMSLSKLASGRWTLVTHEDGSSAFGIPVPFFLLVGVAILAAIFLRKTIYGRYLLALGRNRDAARYSGVDTDRITIMAYVICTGLAALGGILFALDSNSVSPSSFGNFFELYAIAAAVLGGCSLRGGEGGIFGVVIGTAVMQTLYNLIVLQEISDKLEFAIIGAVILAGVIADELLKKIAARRVRAANAD